MLKLWLRLRLRRQLMAYLETGNAADRTAMLQAAKYLLDCGEEECRVTLKLDELVDRVREPEPARLRSVG